MAIDNLEIQTNIKEFDIAPDGSTYLKRETTTTARRNQQQNSTSNITSQTTTSTTTEEYNNLVDEIDNSAEFTQKPDGGIAFNFGFALAMIIVVALLILITQQ